MTVSTRELRVSSVELPTGVRLEYAEQGERGGLAVIFLHGITDSWRSFEHTLPYLPHSIRAFALTQRGHGDSSRPAMGYAPRDLSTDVVAFMDAQELARAVIVGHSMGSLVAQRVAIDHPQRCSGLVLLGSTPTFRSALKEFVDTAVADLDDPIDHEFVREFQESTTTRPLSAEFLRTVVDESLKAPARVWKEAFAALIAADHSGELNQIRSRTLVLWGDNDEMCTREAQDVLLNGIADARLVVVNAANHAVHWDDPQRVASEIAAFIAELTN
jgi:non-heme chloroperoxidase